MKKVMLLMLGVSLFAVSCKKQETTQDNTMSDTATSDTMMSADDTGTSAMPMDTTASVRDSAMNQGNRAGQTATPNQPAGTTNNASGSRADSVR